MSRIDDLLDRQAADLASLEESAARRFLTAYDDARRELREELYHMDATGLSDRTPATAQHLRVMLAQVEDGRRRLVERLDAALVENEREAHGRALGHLLATIKTAEPEFVDTGGAVETAALRGLLAEQGLLLHRYSVDRYAADVIDAVQRELAAGVVRGQTVKQLADRIAGATGSVIAGKRGRAELVVRMELNRAYNAGHQASIVEAASILDAGGTDDPLMRRADEAFDARNNPFSRALHGRLAPIQGEWEVPVGDARAWASAMKRPLSGVVWRNDGDAYRGSMYPAHFNDRGRQVPWRRSWGDPGQRSAPSS